jgi:hypothetical protein
MVGTASRRDADNGRIDSDLPAALFEIAVMTAIMASAKSRYTPN